VEVLFVDFMFMQKYTRLTASIEGRLLVIHGFDALARSPIFAPADLDV
jgi:hypothetical protein